MASIELNDADVLRKTYKLRRTGDKGSTIEVSIPREVLEREARRQGLTLDEALEKLIAVWRFNSFRGLHLDFELKSNAH
jgi:hypothetical protein